MNKAIILALNILLGFTLLSFSSNDRFPAETLIKVSGIRNQKGNLIIQVYKDQIAFEKEQHYKQLTFKKNEIENGNMTIKFPLEPDVYGFTLIDDENGNGKIDKNLIGIPKEGFGFSNFFMENLKKPTFEQFQVNLRKIKNLVIKIKYM